jgi:hypothetical protein
MRVFWFVGLPLTIICGINTFYLEKKHLEHLDDPNDRPAYEYMRIRTKVGF